LQELDRRRKRTRAALLKAFAQLLMSEGYEAITVERVCAQADVGRSTFYLHFAGKDGILRESLAGPSSFLVALISPEVSAENVRPILEHFHEQRKRNWVCFTHPVRALWVKRLGELIEPKLAARVRTMAARPILPLPLVAHHIAEAQIALIATWLGSHASTPAPVVAEALVAGSHGMMTALLRSDRATA
jgi:AcrR family transcriptional regulator